MIEDESALDTVRVKKDVNKSGTADNLTEAKRKIDVDVIANNFEKYMSIKLGSHLTLIDSFNFMSQSLGKLSSSLSKD